MWKRYQYVGYSSHVSLAGPHVSHMRGRHGKVRGNEQGTLDGVGHGLD